MSRQTSGKTLLRNVIRHTDAHNKIQEETEMWKMRDWEIQKSHPQSVSGMEIERRRMYCDRESYQPRYLSQSRMSEHDDREARYWTRKLYEFEANDPDRWGHSGFKELYPEEFQSDREESPSAKIKRHKKKSKSEAGSPKQSKKSSRKKKKKKKKKSEGEKRKKAESSSSGDDSAATKDRQRAKKRKSKNHKYTKIRTDEESSSQDNSDDEKEKGGRTSNHKKRKQASHGDSDSGLNVKKKRRNWKAADEERSCASSAD